MSESETNPKTKTKTTLPPSSSSSSHGDHGSTKYSTHKSHINPPETSIPDAATLRDQWKYAIRQYSKWYSHAWGTAILAGTAFFALGWFIKGENPIPSFNSNNNNSSSSHGDNKDKPSQPH
ncbi:uncharacterized protein [Cicer arietinum]|uniref:Uncharacterized protein LOC101489452 n=1 Tax=Cicer arietinum TaxID=3827 RepID=A0A1S2X9U4_CICAR|nr:uncharacterized protein LOC101489452 [Cicer arietinum]